jgi:hypothetical protein
MDQPNAPLTREEIEFLRELAKADNVVDVDVLIISNRIKLKYNFKEEIGFLLCRELGMYSKVPIGIKKPTISKLTKTQWEFIDKCREWIIAHQTCPRCKSKAGQRKRIFNTKDAAILFLNDREKSVLNSQTAYACPHGNGWHLRTEIAKVDEITQDAGYIQKINTPGNVEKIKEKSIIRTSDKLVDNKIQKMSYQTKEKGTDFSKIKFLADVDKTRISDLKKRARNLDLPKNQLRTLKDVIIWSGRSIPIEAYFIAMYKEANLNKIEITDDDTMMKLRGWLLAVGKNPYF